MKSALVAALACVAVSLAPAPACADTLIDNINGLTLNADGSVQRFGGVLIDDSGRIQQLYRSGEKRPQRVDYRLDGKGQVMMPGLIDSHIELMRLALTRIAPPAPGARPRPEDRDQALADIQKLVIERGITTVIDMGTTIEDWQAYRRAGDAGTLLMRIIGYAATVDDMVLIAGPKPTPWLYDDHLRLIGLRIAFDGAQPAAAPARPAGAKPLAARPSARPPEPTIPLKNLLSRAGIDGFQPAIRVRNPAALPALFDSIAELSQTYKGERRWRLDLGFRPAPDDLARIAAGGMALTLLPSLPSATDSALPASGVAVAKVRLAYGSAARGALPDPFAPLAAALARDEALAASTSDAAWAAFADGRIGRLAIGQRADFILVDRDPLLASSGELRAIRVLQTWVGGRMVYRANTDLAPPRSAAQDR